MTSTSQSSTKRGIFFIVLAMFIFSILNAIVKDITAHYDPIQLVGFRCFFASVPAGMLMFFRKGWTRPAKKEWRLHWQRAFLLAIGLTVLFMGISKLPLSNSMALYFSSTLFLVVLSYPILKEKVGLVQGAAVGIGLIGVLIIAKPGGDVFHWGAIFLIMGSLMESAYNLYGRLLSSTHSSYMITFLGSLLPALIILMVLPFVWIMPDFNGWIALICLGLGGGLGQLCVTTAYRYAPAGVLAPMIYSAMLWSVTLDIILYGNWPTESLFLGCGIIIASGLIIVFHESRKKRLE
ncbi:MAG: DMT family transporter [Alphaproteobacteria bacterium]|nr:DMT family transporter [Alphaproteobacteria bacterium]